MGRLRVRNFFAVVPIMRQIVAANPLSGTNCIGSNKEQVPPRQ
jgi:hypothetical protein